MEKWKVALETIPDNQLRKLKDELNERFDEQEQAEAIPGLTNESCPYCSSDDFVRYGRQSDRQRYQCKECERTFNALTKTEFSNLNKSLQTLKEFVKLTRQGAALRAVADKLNLNLHTAFRWRHKLIEELGEESELSGIIEADETYVPYSKKGDKDLDREPRERGMNPGRGISKNLACILTAKDQNDNLVLKVSGRARSSSDELNQVLSGYINDENTVLCTDGTRSYWPFCRENGLEHEIATSYSSPFTLNHINNLHKQLKEWLKNFNGVATKYLENYLQLFKLHKSDGLSHV